MTSDEFKKHFIAFATPAAAWAAGHYHLSADQMGILTSDLGYAATGAGLLYGMYARWGTKAVPATAVVTAHTIEPNATGTTDKPLPIIPAASLALALLLFAPLPATAADMIPLKAPVRAMAADCTQLDCTGWIVGANIIGTGSNLDIVGSGVNGSIFAGGGLIGVDAGYQLWNGKFFAGAAVSFDYDANLSGNVNQGRYLAMGLFQAGLGLSGIFSPAPANSGPIGIPSQIASALLSPYLQFGVAQRARGTAWVSGAGAEFGLSQTWVLRLDYLHLNYAHGTTETTTTVGVVDQSATENLVKATILRKL